MVSEKTKEKRLKYKIYRTKKTILPQPDLTEPEGLYIKRVFSTFLGNQNNTKHDQNAVYFSFSRFCQKPKPN